MAVLGVGNFQAVATLGQELLPKRIDLKVYKGDSYSFTFNIQDEAQTPVDLSGGTPVVEVRTVSNGNIGTVVGGTVSVDNTNFATGVVVINFTPAHTNAYGVALEPSYVDYLLWELEITLSGVVRTYLGGRINVYNDIVENV
jgi:hypothetical protein